MSATVVVTGGSGFLGSWVLVELLKAGYRVRTTVRSRDKEPAVRALLERGGAATEGRLAFHAADLLADEGWAEACAGSNFVIHVASPLIASRNPDDVIRPAADG